MKFKTIAAACALATLGTAAFAQTYVGVGIGSSNACFHLDVSGNCTGDATTEKLTLGHAFAGTDFALESAYTHMGSFKGSSSFTRGDFKVDILGVGGAWRPQFGAGWGGVLRAGVDWGKVKSSYTAVPPGETTPHGPLTDSTGYWQPYLGVGATYAITPNVRLAADLDVTRVKQSSTPLNVRTVMLGATFGF